MRGSVFIFLVKRLGLSLLILSHTIIVLEPKDFLSFDPTELSSLVKKHKELEPVSHSLLRLEKMEPQMSGGSDGLFASVLAWLEVKPGKIW